MKQLKRVAQGEPSFILEDYFVGRTRAWGMFVNRFGRIRRDFSVDIRGEFENGQLILVEDFAFSDGENSQRIWRITPLGEGRYVGRADDVVGTATGEVIGNRLRWSYDLKLTVGQRVWVVHLDDIMLLQNDRTLLNHASMSKYGTNVGEVVIFFQNETALADEGYSGAGHIESDATRRTRVQGAAAAAVSA